MRKSMLISFRFLVSSFCDSLHVPIACLFSCSIQSLLAARGMHIKHLKIIKLEQGWEGPNAPPQAQPLRCLLPFLALLLAYDDDNVSCFIAGLLLLLLLLSLLLLLLLFLSLLLDAILLEEKRKPENNTTLKAHKKTYWNEQKQYVIVYVYREHKKQIFPKYETLKPPPGTSTWFLPAKKKQTLP